MLINRARQTGTSITVKTSPRVGGLSSSGSSPMKAMFGGNRTSRTSVTKKKKRGASERKKYFCWIGCTLNRRRRRGMGCAMAISLGFRKRPVPVAVLSRATAMPTPRPPLLPRQNAGPLHPSPLPPRLKKRRGARPTHAPGGILGAVFGRMMEMKADTLLGLLLAGGLFVLSAPGAGAAAQAVGGGERAVRPLAGGCFWCMEPPFDALEGVISTTSGYTGGHTKDPTYEEGSAGGTAAPPGPHGGIA